MKLLSSIQPGNQGFEEFTLYEKNITFSYRYLYNKYQIRTSNKLIILSSVLEI